MKSILTISAFLAFAFSANAQVSPEEQHDQQENIQDRIQQEPPRDAQRTVENAARQNNPNQQYNEAQRKQDELLKKEKERSTGQEAKNPAETNPVTVKSAGLSEPVLKPIKRRN